VVNTGLLLLVVALLSARLGKQLQIAARPAHALAENGNAVTLARSCPVLLLAVPGCTLPNKSIPGAVAQLLFVRNASRGKKKETATKSVLVSLTVTGVASLLAPLNRFLIPTAKK